MMQIFSFLLNVEIDVKKILLQLSFAAFKGLKF